MFVDGLVSALDSAPDIRVVGTGGTALAASDLVETHRPDVLLLDHLLPDGSGIDLAAELLSAHALRVVIVTSVADATVISRAIEAGCSGYVTKDRPVDEVVRAIRAAASGDAVISPEMLGQLLRRMRGASDGTPDLTPREREVLQLVARAETYEDIGTRLHMAPITARNHTRNVMDKLGARSKLEAVVTALRLGLIDVPPGEA